MALSFMPFLIYFMLSWKDRMRVATVQLFQSENRRTAYGTLGSIASMLHGFIVGNLMCGLFISGLSVLAFACFKLPYCYFLGFISGFLSLVPYLAKRDWAFAGSASHQEVPIVEEIAIGSRTVGQGPVLHDATLHIAEIGARARHGSEQRITVVGLVGVIDG